MSKLYKKYLELKKEDKRKYYLFKSGIFYIFIDDDAIKISKKYGLKTTNLNKEILKCGFPTNSLEKYMERFKKVENKIVIVSNNEIKKVSNNNLNNDKLLSEIKKIKKLDFNQITPIESLNILKEFKEAIDNG